MVVENIDHLNKRQSMANMADQTSSSDRANNNVHKDAATADEEPQHRHEDTGLVINAKDMTTDLIPQRKKKNKKSKTKSGRLYQRGQGKPTGFEDNFADAPMTAEQYLEFKELFPEELPFVDRILRGIHRFEKTRKMSPERRDIFYKYLAYGGVEVGPNMFQGLEQNDEMDKDELITNTAQSHVSDSMKAKIFDPKAPNLTIHNDSEGRHEDIGPTTTALHEMNVSDNQLRGTKYQYIIDFQTTMRAFLSRRALYLVDLNTKGGIDLVTTTTERFMDYLLQHDVCPEYAAEVLETRDLCRQARAELWACAQIHHNLPGDFNIACSTLFGGSYGRDYDGESYYGPAGPGENVFVGLTPTKATQIVGFGMAALADEEVYEKYAKLVEAGGIFTTATTIAGHGFEVVRIERATDETRGMYRNNVDDIRPVGKIYAKFWRNPETPPEDLNSEERKSLGTSGLVYIPDPENLVFFLEDSTILPFLQTGQKIECTMHKMECGIWFFDQVMRVHPKFEIWIENELVMSWTEPKSLDQNIESSEPAEADENEGEPCQQDSSIEATSGQQHGKVVEAAPDIQPNEQQYRSDDDPY